MLDIECRVGIIQELLDKDNKRHVRYAALECRFALEEICYERLRLAHKYIPLEKVRDWQPPKLLKFLCQEVEPSLLDGTKISVSKTPIDIIKELSSEDYEALEYVELGTRSLLDTGTISKLYYKISKHLHAEMLSHMSDEADNGFDTLKRHVKEVIDELTNLSVGTIQFFLPTKVSRFHCLCGSEICRTVHSLQYSKVIQCLKRNCNITYVPHKTDQGYELHRRVVTIKCPHCDFDIKQEFADIEKLSIFNEHSTGCPKCSGKIKMSPVFSVIKYSDSAI